MSQRTIHRYGWKPSLPGLLSQAADTTGLKILTKVDLRPKMPPAFNQLELGACTANAGGRALQLDAILDGNLTVKQTLSRLWLYWQERRIEGTLAQGDCGAMGHDAFIAAANVGVPAETDWPYVIRNFNPSTPPAKAEKDALTHYKLTKPVHSPAQTETSLKQVLSNDQAVIFGFTVYESFEDEASWSKHEMPIPAKGEQVLGGHEICITGYDDETPGFFECMNSWGTEWEDEGAFLFPTSLLLKKSMCSDFRTIVRAA